MLGARPQQPPTQPHAHGRRNGCAKAQALQSPAAAAAAAAASAPKGEALRQEQRDADIKRIKRKKAVRASQETKRKTDTLRQEQRKQKVSNLRRAAC